MWVGVSPAQPPRYRQGCATPTRPAAMGTWPAPWPGRGVRGTSPVAPSPGWDGGDSDTEPLPLPTSCWRWTLCSRTSRRGRRHCPAAGCTPRPPARGTGTPGLPAATAEGTRRAPAHPSPRGRTGRGERPRLPPGSAASAPGLRLCLTPSHALPLALRGGRRPACLASPRGAHGPPGGYRLPPSTLRGRRRLPAPGMSRWGTGTAPRTGTCAEPPPCHHGRGWWGAPSHDVGHRPP